ncbi:hypothetical protein LCGC14_2115300, partial [marine sediment metagenome]
GYKDAFRSVQRQFIEHFKAKGWDKTEMQCIFVGKKTHRTAYGVNMWWTTDEPYFWDDWVALQFFGRLWVAGRNPGERAQWVFRGDISRPQWQGRVMDGAMDTAYFGTGAFTSPAMIRRCRTLARQGPMELRVYGSANQDNASNFGSLIWVLGSYLKGGSACLPWQAHGSDKCLDDGDSAVGGNGLLAPGDRFGEVVVADMRMKALRDGEQLAQYCRLVGRRYGLNRRQLRAMVAAAMPIRAGTAGGASADNADALRFARVKAWQVAALRRGLAELIVRKKAARAKRPAPVGR